MIKFADLTEEEALSKVTEAINDLRKAINDLNMPGCREKSLAFTKIDEAEMWIRKPIRNYFQELPEDCPELSDEEIAEAVKSVCNGSIDEALRGGLIDQPIADDLRDKAASLGLR